MCDPLPVVAKYLQQVLKSFSYSNVKPIFYKTVKIIAYLKLQDYYKPILIQPLLLFYYLHVLVDFQR